MDFLLYLTLGFGGRRLNFCFHFSFEVLELLIPPVSLVIWDSVVFWALWKRGIVYVSALVINNNDNKKISAQSFQLKNITISRV